MAPLTVLFWRFGLARARQSGPTCSRLHRTRRVPSRAASPPHRDPRAAGRPVRRQQLRLLRVAPGRAHLAGLDHQLPLSRLRGGPGHPLRARAARVAAPGSRWASRCSAWPSPSAASPEGSLPPLWGLALAFAIPFIYGIWIVLQARLTRRPTGPGQRSRRATPRPCADVPDPAPAAAVMTTATALVYAVAGPRQRRRRSRRPTIPREAWLPLLGLGLVATALAIQTFYAGVKRVGAARASLISTIEPVYTIALGDRSSSARA